MQLAALPPTSVSPEKHDDNIRSYTLHYLGCIEFKNRSSFFDDSNPIWQKVVETEYSYLQNVTSCDAASCQARATERVKKSRLTWKEECETILRRFHFLRQTLDNSEDDKQLGQALSRSMREWRASDQYRTGISRVRQWSGRTESSGSSARGVQTVDYKYDPDRDLNVHIIRYRDTKSDPQSSIQARGEMQSHPPVSTVWKEMMRSEKTKVKYLLEDCPSPAEHRLWKLRTGETGESLSYVHFSANNMSWIEQAMARYYGQEVPDYYAVTSGLEPSDKTQTYRILQPEYWRDQMRGSSYSSPYARHMRPICEAISNPYFVGNQGRNMVLFMPYLHWETARRRQILTYETDRVSDERLRAQKWHMFNDKKHRQEEREPLHRETAGHTSLRRRLDLQNRTMKPNQTRNDKHAFDSVMDTLGYDTGEKAATMMMDARTGRIMLRGRRNPLAQLLLDAARLYEASSNYRDKQLIRTYLYNNPPLHPRRALDQAYYWAIGSPKGFDRRQVMYRATSARRELFHSFDAKQGVWLGHDEDAFESCQQCSSAIQKVARVIMVDQLWLWILDEKTIITSFPKRYGQAGQDGSDVHKSIRRRLESAPPSHIRSVFDLALIIIDECSNSLFHHSGLSNLQPQVIDRFSEALGEVSREETTSFERLHNWTMQMNSTKAQERLLAADFQDPLLVITPEVSLLRRIKDITDELHAIMDILKSELNVLEDFITHAQYILSARKASGPDNPPEDTKSHSISGNSAAASSVETPKKEDNESTREFFTLNSEEARSRMRARLLELEHLNETARGMYENVKNLVELKQQLTDSVSAKAQADAANKQGRTIMFFTIVTIIFLPMSFTASIFGMNAIEFGADGSLHITDELAIIFPASLCIISIILTIAFSEWIRTLLWSAITIVSTTIVTKTPIYEHWLGSDLTSRHIRKRTFDLTDRLKGQVKWGLLRRRNQQRTIHRYQSVVNRVNSLYDSSSGPWKPGTSSGVDQGTETSSLGHRISMNLSEEDRSTFWDSRMSVRTGRPPQDV